MWVCRFHTVASVCLSCFSQACHRAMVCILHAHSPRTHLHTHICIHTHIHTYTHTHTYAYTHIHPYVHTYTHIPIHTHIYPYIHTYTHIHTLPNALDTLTHTSQCTEHTHTNVTPTRRRRNPVCCCCTRWPNRRTVTCSMMRPPPWPTRCSTCCSRPHESWGSGSPRSPPAHAR